MGCLLKRFDLIGRMVRVSVLACCGLVLTAGLAADTVIMKNGRSIDGQIVTQNRSEIQIRTTSGIQRLAKADVRRVVFSRRETPDEIAARQAREERERAARLEAEQAAAQAAADAAAKKAAEDAAAAAAEEARQAELRSRSPFGAIWRSAVLPGWGQAYQDRFGAALGFGGGFLAAAGLHAYTSQEFSAGQSAYNSAAADLNFSVVLLGAGLLPLIDVEQTLRPQVLGLQFYTLQQRDAAFGRLNRASRNVQLSALLLGGIYVANLIDVVLYKPSDTSSVGVYAAPSGAGVRLQMSW